MLVEYHRKLGTPTTNETFDVELEKEINAWAEENVIASESEDSSGSEGLQRKLTREEVNKRVAKLKNRKAAGSNERIFHIISVTTQVAISRRAHRYNIALTDGQAARRREDTGVLMPMTWGWNIDEE